MRAGQSTIAPLFPSQWNLNPDERFDMSTTKYRWEKVDARDVEKYTTIILHAPPRAFNSVGRAKEACEGRRERYKARPCSL